ncbi:hypothetical protein AMEX_G24879 [Astyanax mexicanus]|uniref:Uncharacterized protein n=1 Tax=Astyanax mexicanus TaxID=7994 RepID=A0A8T2KU11_ASTMX|nr:hypothetical protein AMEX_G24879 [Astyanax mexicanus]
MKEISSTVDACLILKSLCGDSDGEWSDHTAIGSSSFLSDQAAYNRLHQSCQCCWTGFHQSGQSRHPWQGCMSTIATIAGIVISSRIRCSKFQRTLPVDCPLNPE